MPSAPSPLAATLTVALALMLGACTTQPVQNPTTTQGAQMEHINMSAKWPYPFSSAVRVDNMLYLSGQIGSRNDDGTPKLVAGGIEAETRQALDNIKAVLERSGSSMDRVVKCMVMMADMSEWPKMNEVYATYFPGPKPARSAWGANGLALGARVEITCFALVGEAK